MENNSAALSRRKFLTTFGCAFAGSLALPTFPDTARGQTPPRVQLGDAHVHLFNLADLPARGFFEHAVMWNTELDYWLLRPMWPAMLDMISFLKSKSITASQELAAYRYDPITPEDIDRLEFINYANLRISNLARQSRVYQGIYRVTPPAPLSTAQQQLRDSYYQLGAYLAIFGEPIWRRQPGEGAVTASLRDEDVIRIRRGAQFLHERSCPEAPATSGNMSMIETIRNTLEWGRMLMQSRQHHLHAYRDRIGQGPFRPSTAINLLVDYDEWLGDGPAPGSDSDAQIELWDRIRADYAGSIDIRTFAGFDPLKDGLERRGFRGPTAPAEGTTFERHCAHFRQGRIHGFKLYPPMGFRPAGNQASMFGEDRRALRVVRARLEGCGIGWGELPEMLNEALDGLYRFCAANDVPILAHAFHSNEASLCAGVHAGPSGWLEVLRQHEGLRICLGHFAEGVDFVNATNRRRAGRSVHPRNWPYYGTDALLDQNRDGPSEVFVDLGYMAEFLDVSRGLERAVDFFRALQGYCRQHDRDCHHVMFGTDWIMLEREARNGEYVARMREAMAVAGWEDDWQENLLYNNLQRFLRRA